MFRILILAFALGIAVAAVAYHSTARYLGTDDAPRTRRALEWPAPPSGTPPHPLRGRLPALAAANESTRRAAWVALVRGTDYPHPARRPAGWPLQLRVLTRHVLWALYRGRPYRSGGREVRIDVAAADARHPGAVVIECHPGSTGLSPAPWPDPLEPRVSLIARGDAQVERLPPSADDRRAWPRFAVRTARPIDVVVVVELDGHPSVISNRLRITPGQSTTGE